MLHIRLPLFAALGLAIIATAMPLRGDDWPRWMGPTADGVYRESGIVDAIPAAGLQVKWRVPIAGGYAGPAVVGDRVFVFDYAKSAGESFNDPGKRADLSGSERVLCINATSGKTVWKYEYDCPYSISYPAGPRCTPTVDLNASGEASKVYVLGSEGDLTCLDAITGSPIWKRNFKTEMNAPVPIWGFSAHPLVDGEFVYCMVGGEGQTVVALDKLSGEVRWQALSASAAGYCPPSMIESAGVKQLMVWHADGIESLNPLTGSPYWEMPIKPDFDMAIARPQRSGDRVYASAIRNHSVMFSLDSDKPSVTELWRGEPKNSVYSANSTPIFKGDVIFGTYCNEGSLMAIDAASGERLWKTFAPTQPGEERRVNHGTAFLTRIDGTDRYLLMSETGDLIMAELTRDGYQDLGRFHVLEPTAEAFGRDVVWSHPAYANQTAYIRNDRELVAVSLAK